MQTATNPQTGEKLVLQNGQWVSMGNPAPSPQPQSFTVGTPKPRLPSPQTQAQAESDVLGNQSKRVSMADVGFNNADKLRTEFQGLPQVRQYTDAANALSGMLQAPNDGQGDLQVIYAFAKIMDPGSVVREGEMAMANQTASLIEDIQRKYGQISEGNRLPPNVRRGLVESARQKMAALNATYGQSYKHYRDLAQQHGFDAEQITGPYAGDTVRPVEEQYIRAAGGTPRHQDGTAVAVPRAVGPGDIGFNTPDRPNDPLNDQQQAAYDLFLQANPNATPEQLQAFGNSIGVNVENASAIIDARNKGAGVQPGSSAVAGLTPEQQADVDRIVANNQGGGAFGAGAGDTLSSGFLDEAAAGIGAVGQSLSGDGSFVENYGNNLAVNRAVADRLSDEHPLAYGGGQLAGALALPNFGARSIPQFAGLGAAYGGAYGAGSADSLSQIPENALLGALTGAAVPVALGKGGQIAKGGIAAAGRKIFGEATPEQRALLQAGAEEGIPLNMGDVYPQARNSVATLETIPGSSGPVRGGIAAGRDAMERRVGELGRGGSAAPDDLTVGATFQEAGKKFVGDVRNQAKKLYGAARREGDGVQVIPDNADRKVTELLAKEEAVPGGTKAGAVIRRYAEAFQKGEPITIEGARKMRSELASRLREDGGLTKQDATRLTGEIMQAVNQDIEEAFVRAGKGNAAALYKNADRFYSQAMDEVEQVTEKFIGTDARPKTAGQTLTAIQTAIGPKGDPSGFRAMFQRLSTEERKDFAATLAGNLGRKSAEEPFSPAEFVSNVRKLSPQARRIIFGSDGERSIDNLVRIGNANSAAVNRLNNSRSGQVSNYRAVLFSALAGLPGGGALAGLAGAAPGTGAVVGGSVAATALGASRAWAKALMNEEFTRLVANAPNTISPRAIDAHFGKLRQLATKDPAVRSVVEDLERSLLSAANDNVGGASRAAAQPEPEQ